MVSRVLVHIKFLVCLCLMVACTADTPATSQFSSVSPDSIILAYGDSLTYGVGASEAESYPYLLGELSGRSIHNAGRPGELSKEGLDRLPRVLEEVNPALVILIHGGNDLLQRRSLEALKDSLRQMILLCQEQGVEVLLVGVPRPALPPVVPELYRELAAETGVPFEDEVLLRVLTDNGLKSDRVHPNARGYAKMAEAFQTFLQEAGAL